MFSVLEQDGSLVLQLRGDLDIFSVSSIQNDITRLISAARSPHLVIDLGSVGFLDSCGVGMLVKSQQLVRKKGGSVRIANANGDHSRIFKISGLDRYFSLS